MKSSTSAALLVLLVGSTSFFFQACVPQPKSETEAEPSAPQQKQPTATPHPAKEAVAEAVRRYPALGQKDSALNRKFLALHNETAAKEPELLSHSDWPITLATRAASALGIQSTDEIKKSAEKEQVKQQAMQLIRKSKLKVLVSNIEQITDGGILMAGMNATDASGKNGLSEDLWYLVGYDQAGLVDGAEVFNLTVYVAGTYRYRTAGGSTRTVARYAATPEIAYELLNQEAAKTAGR